MSIGSFLEEVSSLEDPRISGMVTYPLNEILLCTLCGVICGNEDFEEIEDWGNHHIDYLRRFLPYANGIPSSVTLIRLFRSLDSKSFEISFEKWASSLSKQLKSKHIALDGKVIKGSKHDKDGSGAINIISAYASDLGLVLGQEKVADKSNEITGIPLLLDRLSIEGTVITIDALGTQKEITNKIREKKADYVLSLKRNHRELFEEVELFFKTNDKDVIWDDYEEADCGHGRVEVRRCTTTSDIEWIKKDFPDWKDLKSVVMIESSRFDKKTRKENKEIRYYLSSLPAQAEKMQKLVRSHWAIENSLHWVLDMTFREDSCRTRMDHGPKNFATVRKIALNLLKNNKENDNKKVSIKRKKRRANWDTELLTQILTG